MSSFAPLAILFALLLTLPASANQLELYPLTYRGAEEIIPLLEPVLPPDTSLSGRGTQLIVRGSAAAHDEVRRLLPQFDTAPRSLRISVRIGSSGAVESDGISAGGGGLRIYRSEDARSAQLSQQVQGLEGRPAFIARSLNVPVTTQRAVISGRRHAGVEEHTEFLELRKGFYAIARTSGGRVEVDIAAERAAPHHDVFQRHEVVTSVSGRLGEWLQIGSSGEHRSRDERGIIYRSESARETNETVWLRVEALD